MDKRFNDISNDDIESVECKFVTHTQDRNNRNDIHLVKEIITTKDGKKHLNLRLLNNYQRDFYITNKAKRNYQQPKERMHVDNLRRFQSTQRELPFRIARALGWSSTGNNPRNLISNIHVFGAEISSTTLIKERYQTKFPDSFSPFTVCALDIETDVLGEYGKIIMCSITFKERIYTVILKSFVSKCMDVEDNLHRKFNKYLSQYKEERNLQWEFDFVDTESEITIKILEKLHLWMPDFVAIWNIDFDLPILIESLKKAGLDPAQYFSDPIIPPSARSERYREGRKVKVMASGKAKPLAPSEQWHTYISPASFYFIDPMSTFRFIRAQSEGSRASYSLDAIAKDELNVGKLKIGIGDDLMGLEWHVFMQSKHPLDYIIYNVFDCLLVEMIDEKTKDLQLTLPLICEVSDFATFPSQPRRLADKLYFREKRKGYILGATNADGNKEFNDDVVPTEGIIIALPAELRTNQGLTALKESPLLRSSIYAMVADLDIKSAYPTNQIVLNISRETTLKEIIEIEGQDWEDYKYDMFNLVSGDRNAIEFSVNMFNLPSLDELLDIYQKEINLNETENQLSSVKSIPDFDY